MCRPENNAEGPAVAAVGRESSVTANGGNGQQLGFVFGPTQLNVEGYDKVADAKSKDGKMSGLKAVSDTTIEMTLAAPIGQTLFENYLAGPQVLPMPSEAFKDVEAYNKKPIGNGPYMLKDAWDTTGADAGPQPGLRLHARQGRRDRLPVLRRHQRAVGRPAGEQPRRDRAPAADRTGDCCHRPR